MPSFLARIVDSRWFAILGRLVLTFVFWGSGLSKLLDFKSGVAEMAHYGLEPAFFFNLAAVVTLLGGSALVLLNRHAWLGCGMLAVFTGLTIPIAHRFWAMSDPQEALMHFFFFAEHVSLIGGLMVMTILSRRPRRSAVNLPTAALAPAE